jgi:O-antigen/teichoic acid export membrane protein
MPPPDVSPEDPTDVSREPAVGPAGHPRRPEAGGTGAFTRGTVSRDAAWSLAYSALLRGSTMAVSIFVARRLGPLGTGAFGIALQLTGLGGLFAAFGLPQSLTRHLAESDDPARRRALIRAGVTMVATSALVVGGLLSVLAGVLADRAYRDPSLGATLVACGPLVVVTALYFLLEAVMQGYRRFGALARWGAGISALDIVAGAFAVAWGVVGVLISRAVLRIGAVLVASTRRLGLWPAAAPGAPEPSFAASARVLLSFATPGALSAAVVLAGQTALRTLLVRSHGLAAGGQYQAADSLAQGLMLVPVAAGIAFLPAVSRMHAQRDRAFGDSLRNAIARVVGFNLPLCLVLMGVVPWLLVTLFGRAFGPARPVMVALACAYGLAGPAGMVGAAMLGRGEVWAAGALNALWALVMLGAYVGGLSSWGALGAAFAVAAGYLVMLSVCVVVVIPRWGVSRTGMWMPLAATLGSLALGAALSLAPGVPVAWTVSVCALLAAAVFTAWGRTSLMDALRGGSHAG